MTTAFTICANNYLAHAKTLALSFKKKHPSVKFVIAILDNPIENIAYNDLGADEILWIPEIAESVVNEMKVIYTIAELCTVVKPLLFKRFYTTGCKTVLYIDPDIKVFSAFKEVFGALENMDVVLTPHICSPTGEKGHPLDKDIMRTGIYNLGFLAMNKTKETLAFINWWDKRVKAFGFHDLKKGFFYDQIWLGYAPAFLEKVYILRHLGYNVANWNLHERKIVGKEGHYYINSDNIPLRFFHYSHYKIEHEPDIACYNENFNLEDRTDIVPIFSEYKTNLIQNQYYVFKSINYAYGKRVSGNKTVSIKQMKKNRLYRSLSMVKKAIRILIKGN